MDVDTNAFISGGYFLTKRVGRPRAISDLAPDSIITLSNCFTEIAPDSWADKAYSFNDEERAAEAFKFGIPGDAVPSLADQFTMAVESTHITNFFPNLPIAQEFHRFCTDQAVVLVGIGLHVSLLQSLKAQLGDDVNRGYGLIERVDANIPVADGGDALGYEPLGFEATKFHSWLCHNAPVEAHKQFGIRPNRAGFIDAFNDAVRVTENLKATGAELAIWEPWLVVQYGR